MSAEFIAPTGLATLANAAGYDLVVRSGDLVFLSGMTARNANVTTVGIGDFETQCVQVYGNMKTCVEAAGGCMPDVVSLRVFRSDRAQRTIHSAVRLRYFPGPHFPCSTLLIVELRSPDLLVEIEAVAHVASASAAG